MRLTDKRPTCKCGRLTAINYKKNGKTYYRKLCSRCGAEAKKPKREAWEIAGYIKKPRCEKCGFKAKYANQITAIAAGNTFKSVCLNCNAELVNSGGWKQGDLVPDA